MVQIGKTCKIIMNSNLNSKQEIKTEIEEKDFTWSGSPCCSPPAQPERAQ
jgi:hypothetical protein